MNFKQLEHTKTILLKKCYLVLYRLPGIAPLSKLPKLHRRWYKRGTCTAKRKQSEKRRT